MVETSKILKVVTGFFGVTGPRQTSQDKIMTAIGMLSEENVNASEPPHHLARACMELFRSKTVLNQEAINHIVKIIHGTHAALTVPEEPNSPTAEQAAAWLEHRRTISDCKLQAIKVLGQQSGAKTIEKLKEIILSTNRTEPMVAGALLSELVKCQDRKQVIKTLKSLQSEKNMSTIISSRISAALLRLIEQENES